MKTVTDVNEGKKKGFYREYSNGAATLFTPKVKAILTLHKLSNQDQWGDVCSNDLFMCEIINIKP